MPKCQCKNDYCVMQKSSKAENVLKILRAKSKRLDLFKLLWFAQQNA